MSKTLTITALKLLPPLTSPLTVSLYYFQYLSATPVIAASDVTVNTNGSLSSPVVITGLSENVRYTLQAVNEFCETVYQEDFIFNCANTCPPGYTLSADTTYCYKLVMVPATPPTTSQDSVAVQNINYGICGSWIFSSFNLNGTGVATQISTANSFWNNGPGNCSVTGTTSDGPLNRTGLWTATPLDNQTVGFTVCFDIPTTGTYYVGMGSDNYATVQVDGVNLIVQDPTALDAQFGTSAGTSTFRVWFIYPITLTAGTHVLAVIGTNINGPAAIGAEIYNNTAAEIASATDYTGLDLVFSSMNEIGQPIQIGNSGYGYTCPAGYTLSSCTSPYVCVGMTTTDPIC